MGNALVGVSALTCRTLRSNGHVINSTRRRLAVIATVVLPAVLGAAVQAVIVIKIRGEC